MNADDFYTFEENVYVQPEVSGNEQLAFIDQLREMQTQANQQIQEQTYNLGTDVPANLGGLTSGATNPNSWFMSRYQTPQVDAQVANLRTAAQLSKLNQLLANEQAQAQHKYNQAKRAASRRAMSNFGGPGGTQDPFDITTGGIDEESIPIDSQMGTPETVGGSISNRGVGGSAGVTITSSGEGSTTVTDNLTGITVWDNSSGRITGSMSSHTTPEEAVQAWSQYKNSLSRNDILNRREW